ncbi:hypothetical protein [Phenylobacterium sp.]|uniref:hypothetical protein n=1 Tax=Phenylobacterium sp. TaxID=1871053 RepID=UPI0008C88F1F|nr:hypothetical protein [Phenylobacterium sp.]MBC7167894.1 hypothetical protein [Phenylobacterium sp.]OHB39664.1 MAG: hypothetical protein A2882_08490 [Phenylobacterium sp. RIFCSPHIGHO2_01_FULL_70_10]
MSLNEYSQRRVIWALQPSLLARAKRMSDDLNEAYGLVHSAVLEAALRSPPDGVPQEEWVVQLLDKARPGPERRSFNDPETKTS